MFLEFGIAYLINENINDNTLSRGLLQLDPRPFRVGFVVDELKME
jgi:hypothetical protein